MIFLEMYLLTRVSPLNFESHPNPDSKFGLVYALVYELSAYVTPNHLELY